MNLSFLPQLPCRKIKEHILSENPNYMFELSSFHQLFCDITALLIFIRVPDLYSISGRKSRRELYRQETLPFWSVYSRVPDSHLIGGKGLVRKSSGWLE